MRLSSSSAIIGSAGSSFRFAFLVGEPGCRAPAFPLSVKQCGGWNSDLLLLGRCALPNRLSSIKHQSSSHVNRLRVAAAKIVQRNFHQVISAIPDLMKDKDSAPLVGSLRPPVGLRVLVERSSDKSTLDMPR